MRARISARRRVQRRQENSRHHSGVRLLCRVDRAQRRERVTRGDLQTRYLTEIEARKMRHSEFLERGQRTLRDLQSLVGLSKVPARMGFQAVATNWYKG